MALITDLQCGPHEIMPSGNTLVLLTTEITVGPYTSHIIQEHVCVILQSVCRVTGSRLMVNIIAAHV